MNNIYVDVKFGNKFSNFVSKLFKNLLIDSIKDPRCSRSLLYLEKKFNVSKDILLQEVRSNGISITSNSDYFTLYINKNIKINDYSLDTIIDFIEYGNREIKGMNKIAKGIENINSNIFHLYMYYKMKGGKE